MAWVPKDSLLFIITAFGGVVSWEGEASPFSKADESIMLQIAEEQPQSNMFPSRRYVRLTWVYDSILLQISPLSSSHQTTTLVRRGKMRKLLLMKRRESSKKLAKEKALLEK
ncbi:pescadillo homolog isoform X2 [Nymphaea colorata]|uniref:pescadillo homolog isoform X2 n=1 Tax=Nymphaea colorata TaxID=210225 RepID=UPI00214ED598|nr:pescadillo homolog isoform X2 [Nymphaea colorata]